MQVILTHEQADFDAIASLLGAHILQDGGYPVLPKTFNRNVRKFLHLYSTELPFIQPTDLPKRSISTATLVDTQSLVTIRGINKKTKVFVIDHHMKKSSLNPDWEFNHVVTSACTTYFVEKIIENNSYHLNIIEATLFLLGIYEDTGSLTYANTTARDASAVAYLLSEGASLKIAAEFLNPPLSAEQQALFEALMNNAQTLTISGKDIFISHAEAPELGDEVSSVAHKISDLLDPDALFIFVSIQEGIRLVARSVTDQIDTSIIAQGFNGGGHQKASAALIKHNKKNPNQLTDIVNVFVNELNEHVQPAISVEQIMSKGPLTITPETTVKEARLLMHRFGYEGYPVVDNNKILGLLNRRAIDKAHGHNLDTTASRLMEVGEFHVFPDDSLDHLQQLMVETGWGQIPVINPDTKEIIGIATRTDLLKTIAGTYATTKLNVTSEMENQIPAGQFTLLKIISAAARELSTPIFLVGGFVRDLILNVPSPDLDFVVEGDALELASLLARKYSGKVTSHKKFGTAKWWPLGQELITENDSLPIPPEQINDIPQTIDLISARTEFYEKPTALPTIKKGSIKLDLHRRDFTINSMAARLDGNYFGDVYDHWGGMNDLKEKRIRVLHSLSFVDDPTRMLRAVRFEQRFGFNIETRTLDLMLEAAPLLDEVSGDRIRHELDQILKDERRTHIFERLNQLNLLQQIQSSIQWNDEIVQELDLFSSHKPTEAWADYLGLDNSTRILFGCYAILLLKLLPSDLKDVIKRLRFHRNLQKILLNASEIWDKQNNFSTLSAGEFCTTIEKYSPLSVYIIWLITKKHSLKEKIQKYVQDWRLVHPISTGEKLKAYGIPPGPIYRSILHKLRIAWIDGEITNKKEELKFLEDMLEIFSKS